MNVCDIPINIFHLVLILWVLEIEEGSYDHLVIFLRWFVFWFRFTTSHPFMGYFMPIVLGVFKNTFYTCKQPLMMAYGRSKSTRNIFGKFIHQFQPETKTLIWKLERILIKSYRQNVSLLFNQTCLYEKLLPNTHTHTHIYIYIYIYIYKYH